MEALPERLRHLPNKELFDYRPLSDQQRRDFEQNGYALYGKAVNDLALEVIREECMYFWNADERDHAFSKEKP